MKIILSDKIKQYVHYLNRIAKKDVQYSYSCLMVRLPKALSSEIVQWGEDNISDNHLADDGKNSVGREDDIHTTLFYGIKSKDPQESIEILSKVKPFKIRLGLIDVFKDQDDYDVIKIQIESKELEKLHYEIEDKVENANTYPTYIPHVTIAYVKKGSCDNLIGNKKFKGKIIGVDKVIFSSSDGSEKYISLNS
jgi:2'-5' RNA ligase